MFHDGMVEHFENTLEEFGIDVEQHEQLRDGIKAIKHSGRLIDEANKRHDQIMDVQAYNASQKKIALFKYMEKKGTELGDMLNDPVKELGNLASSIDQEIDQATEQSARTGEFARATWDHVKGLPKNARTPFIRARIKNDDWETVDNILGAPSYLSGLEDEDIKTHKNIYKKARFGHEINIRDQARKMADTITKGYHLTNRNGFHKFDTKEARQALKQKKRADDLIK